MTRLLRALTCLLLAATLPLAAAGPEFEVASVKPSADQVNPGGVGVHVDGSQARFTGMSLKQYIGVAYRVKPHQIVGPDWLGQARFDVAATIPSGTPPGQVPEMLQALLADRFQLKLHHESKEFSVFALTVAKGGLKIQPTPPDAPGSERPRSLDVTAGGSAAGAGANLGNGASFTLGNNHLQVEKLTMVGFAELLTRFSDRPVIDATAATGTYDVGIDINPEDFTPVMVRAAVNNGNVLPAPALRLLDNASSDPFSAGLQKAGLTLEPRKAPLDVVVIESVQRTPTAN